MTRNRSWSLRPDPKRYLSPIADIGAKYTPLKAVSVALCSTGAETEVSPFVADLMSTAGPHQSSACKRSADRDAGRCVERCRAGRRERGDDFCFVGGGLLEGYRVNSS